MPIYWDGLFDKTVKAVKVARQRITGERSQTSIKTLGSTYYKGVPLPRIPQDRKLGKKSYISQKVNCATVQPCRQ